MTPPAGSGPDMILKDLSQSLTIGHEIMIYLTVLHCIMTRFASPGPRLVIKESGQTKKASLT